MILQTEILKVEVEHETYKRLKQLQRQLKKEGLNHSIDEITNSLLRDFINLPKEEQEKILRKAMSNKGR